MTSSFCVHCHFHQPDRGDPFALSGDPGREAGAQPYDNFNEKAADMAYTPNASAGSFERMSFDIGSALIEWLRRAAPETHAAIVEADRAYTAEWGVGNGLAAPQHHTVLPLARRRDKITQVAWGLATFAHHFGRPAEGMWLPDMAVDLETLETLAALGLKFTILSAAQVTGAGESAGPYRVDLGGGKEIAVYVRDDTLSNQVAFELPSLGGAGRWARGTLAPRRKSGCRLTLIATDGESFGYHHRGEEHFLHWLLAYEAVSAGYEVTTLGYDLRENPAQETVEIKEFTAWNCPHGQLRRWSTGCECTPGDSAWKGPLRRALDNAASSVDEGYVGEAAALGLNPWPLRDAFIRTVLGEVSGEDLLREHGATSLTGPETERLLTLLEAVFFRQRMYASSGWFHGDLARPEAAFCIANAARALQLLEQATGQECLSSLRTDLSMATGLNGWTAANILDEVVAKPRPLPGTPKRDRFRRGDSAF